MTREDDATTAAPSKVDCVINVFGKPAQTALALLSLLRSSRACAPVTFRSSAA